MALVRLDLDKRHRAACRIQRMHNRPRVTRRKQPVGRERNNTKPRFRPLERLRQHAVIIGGQIKIIHRTRQIEIGIRIEPLDK